MPPRPQIRIPATFIRGGTSKGIFFRLEDLPEPAQTPGTRRDSLLLRILGSPDRYGKNIDGMGGPESTTNKAVILSKSTIPEHDIDYLIGQAAIDKRFIDWSGNCGNLAAAVGPYAISAGIIDSDKVPQDGIAIVRIWQVNTKKTIIAKVPMVDGKVQELGDFEVDGVPFPAAEIPLEFLDPTVGLIFPTGNLTDELDVPGIGQLSATLINCGDPTVFIDAKTVGCNGTELQKDVNNNPQLLAKLENIRAYGALKMGIIHHLDEITNSIFPKITFVVKPTDYVTSCGKTVKADEVDLLARAISLGKLHHTLPITVAMPIAASVAIPGTLVNLVAGGGTKNVVRIGHPAGVLKVEMDVEKENEHWKVNKVVISRSARALMEGWVKVPADCF